MERIDWVAWRGEDLEGMVLVLVVEMGMDMALVREIEMKDGSHVQHEAWISHALLLKIHR
jgi:hypothetical protein